ncbi:MAG: DMT family transporter [Gammaproteobacteria bacterium]|nr:DMT family transporter [Gammaproteobacteria bacterium]
MTSPDRHRTTSRDITLGVALAAFAAVGFSAKGILAKLIYAHDPAIDAITVISLRMLFSLPLFVVIAWYVGRGQRAMTLTGGEWIRVIVLGMLGYYVASFLDFWGLRYLSASLERLVLYLYPTMVVLLSALLERRPIRGADVGALVLSYAGIGVAVGGEVTLASRHLLLGTALVLASAATFAVFMVRSGRLIVRLGSLRYTAYAMIAACGATLAHFAVAHDVAVLMHVDAYVYGVLATMALFSTVLPVFFMTAGIRRLGAARTSIVGAVGPIAALVFAHWLLDEALTLLQLIGAVLVLSGVVVSSMKRDERVKLPKEVAT